MTNRIWRTLFAFRGRISRSSFWWSVLLIAIAFIVLYVFLENLLGRASTLVLYPPLIWILAALCVKRMHDRGKSSWRLLIVLIPALGPLWLFVSLGLRAGTAGENQYGNDPLAYDTDYLTVK